MKFSVLSWNIEHFKASAARLKKVATHIRKQSPDIFCLLEVESMDVRTLMEKEFAGYDFALTDGPQVQEILVGWRRAKFDQAIFSQKREFDVGNSRLRPGALLSVRQAGVWYNLLFLHTDSGTDAPAFGNRAEMFDKTWSLKSALDKNLGGAGASRLIVMGDLNTMGLMFPRPAKKFVRVDAPTEIAALGEAAAAAGMALLKKDRPATWKGSAGESDLDHAMASASLAFTRFGSAVDAPQVKVKGWPDLSGAEQTRFLADMSDHASMYLEVV
jgi:endonuclease/exonuclease/phosphatase family metal-dependent hydrolase